MAESSTTFKRPTFITLHIRLDRNNYSYWRSQVLANVKGQGFDYILLCKAVPHFDPEHTDEQLLWIRRDQFLLSWMLSSISESMLGYVHRCAHSFEVWQVFEDLFQSQSRARVMNLCFQLQTLKKGDLPVDDYILKMRGIADDLNVAVHIMKDEDLIMYLLGGLGSDFDAVVVNLTTRGDVLSISEVQSILHTHEMRLLQHNSSLKVLSTNPIANYASKDNKGNNSGGSFKSKGKFFSKQKTQCQLCGKNNHVSTWYQSLLDSALAQLHNCQPCVIKILSRTQILEALNPLNFRVPEVCKAYALKYVNLRSNSKKIDEYRHATKEFYSKGIKDDEYFVIGLDSEGTLWRINSGDVKWTLMPNNINFRGNVFFAELVNLEGQIYGIDTCGRLWNLI